MRPLGEAEWSAGEDVVPLADKPLLRGRVLLQHDAGETVLSRPVVPQHVDEVLPAVLVMKERRIESTAIQVDRVRPVSVDAGARDEIVVEVPQRRAPRATRSGAPL